MRAAHAQHTAYTCIMHHACTQPTHCTHRHCLDAAYTGVLQLKDLPALMSEARAGAEARDDEVSFVLGSVAHTRNGDMLTDDDVSDAVSIDVSTHGGGQLNRAELLPALTRIQLDDRDVGTAPGTVEELSDGEDSDEADGLRSIVKLPLPAAAHVPLHPPPFQKPATFCALGPGGEPPPIGHRRAAFNRPGPELPHDCWTAAAPGEGATPGVAPGDSLAGKTQNRGNGSRRKGTPPTGGICTLQ